MLGGRSAFATINRRSCYKSIVFFPATLFISSIKTIIFSYYSSQCSALCCQFPFRASDSSPPTTVIVYATMNSGCSINTIFMIVFTQPQDSSCQQSYVCSYIFPRHGSRVPTFSSIYRFIDSFIARFDVCVITIITLFIKTILLYSMKYPFDVCAKGQQCHVWSKQTTTILIDLYR